MFHEDYIAQNGLLSPPRRPGGQRTHKELSAAIKKSVKNG